MAAQLFRHRLASPAAAWVWVALAAAAFVWLTMQIVGPAPAWDVRLLAVVTEQRGVWGTAILRSITWLGDSKLLLAMVAVAVLALFWRRRFEQAAFIAAAGLGGLLLSRGLKAAIARPRPAHIEVLSSAQGYAFPSGHSTASMLLFLLCLALASEGGQRTRSLVRRWLWLGLVLVAAVGLSRIYLAVHHPSDVLGGWLLASSWVLLVQLLRLQWRRLQPSSASATSVSASSW